MKKNSILEATDWTNKHDRRFVLSIIVIGVILPLLLTAVTDLILLHVTNGQIFVSAVFSVFAFALWMHLAVKVLASMFIYFADKNSEQQQ